VRQKSASDSDAADACSRRRIEALARAPAMSATAAPRAMLPVSRRMKSRRSIADLLEIE
jgi:hypothetical protein